MTEASALDPAPDPLTASEQAVQRAYQAAQASGWAAEQRPALWHAACEAVLAHAASAGDTAAARRHFWLLIDLAPESPEAGWSERPRRALRLAATHSLAHPGKPERRARAQALLKRLDLLENPLLEARERVLAAIAAQNHALRSVFLRQRDGSRLGLAAYQAGQARLARVTSALRHMPTESAGSPEAAIALLATLHDLIATGAIFEPELELQLYILVQRLPSPEAPPALLGAALATMETLLAQPAGGLEATRGELVAMLYDLTLAGYRPDEEAAVGRHLEDLAHIARHLPDIPAERLPGLLFRLRCRLMDPTNEAIEPVIDAGVTLLEKLEAARRAGVGEALDADGASQAHAFARARLALLSMRTHGLGPSQVGGVLQVLRQLDELVFAARLPAEAFAQTLNMLAEQLRRPALIGHRPWHAGRTALTQLVSLRQGLEERLRGLPLERHLAPADREARRAALLRQLEELDRARLIFGSMPLDRVGIVHERAALEAVQAFSLACRMVAANGDPAGLRQALDAVMQICRRPM